MQQIKQSTINYTHNTDGGDNNIKGIGKKVQGAWCMTGINYSVIGNSSCACFM